MSTPIHATRALRRVPVFVLAVAMLAAGIVAAGAAPSRDVSADESDPIVAYVDGDPINASTFAYAELVLNGDSTLAAPDHAYSTTEARAAARDKAITQLLLEHEATRRGIVVTAQEQQDALADYLAWIHATASIDAEFAHVRTVLGITEAEQEARLDAWIRSQLLVGKLQTQLDAESPTPSSSEVNAYIAAQGLKPGQLQVMTMFFTDRGEATDAYDDLAALQASEPPTDFATTFVTEGAARSALDPDAPVTSLSYAGVDELPRYAQAAVTEDEGTLGIADNGGTTALYLVLAKRWTSPQAIQAQVTATLTDQKRAEYAQTVADMLASSASILILE
ncbi:MAG: hypothetical protein U0470_06875 [Anaerolineae bacterium]